MLRLHVGTSGYNFPEWKGSFYPPKLPSAKWLEYYAQQLRTVEINYTFYRMPSAKTIAGWDAITPAEFTFVLKAPQRITHFMRLRNIDEPLRLFLDTIRKLNISRKTLAGSVIYSPNFRQMSAPHVSSVTHRGGQTTSMSSCGAQTRPCASRIQRKGRRRWSRRRTSATSGSAMRATPRRT